MNCYNAIVPALIITANQPRSKECIQGYLFPLPVAVGPVPHNIYDATAGNMSYMTIFSNLNIVLVLHQVERFRYKASLNWV